MKIDAIAIEKPDDVNVILGQAHFIKAVEDIHEALVSAVPGIAFGLAFCESSGPCLVRSTGTNTELIDLAQRGALAIGAGHSFIAFLRNAYPINVLPVLRQVPEICGIYCATANRIEVVIAEAAQGRGILGVVDGFPPKGVEQERDVAACKELLRELGYKFGSRAWLRQESCHAGGGVARAAALAAAGVACAALRRDAAPL
jgi:adenosine/AMP kinase